MKYLILGGSGRLGSGIKAFFRNLDKEVLVSVRRVETAELNAFEFDIEKENFESLPLGPGLAFVCIGITSISEINNNLSRSYFINVCQTLKLINALIEKKWQVVYFSSDVVNQNDASGVTGIPDFYKNYFLQKSIIESNLNNVNFDQAIVVRLSKIIFENLQDLKNIFNPKIKVLRDNHFVSFVSLPFICSSILKIAESNNKFNYICGNKYYSYYQLAKELELHGILPKYHYTPITAETSQVFKDINFNQLEGIKLYKETKESLFAYIKRHNSD